MPNQQKKVIFCMAGVLSFTCALGVVTALGTPLWIKATFLCKTGALLVNASGQELDKFMGEMQYGLFHGEGVRQCGLGARPFRFSYFPDLMKWIPTNCYVSFFFSYILIVGVVTGLSFFLFNGFGLVYKRNICPNTLFVPSIAGSCGCLVMILFASEVKIHHLSEKIANYKEGTYAYKTQSEKYTTSFWVIFICFFVHFLNGLLIRLAGFRFPFAKSKDTETTNVAVDLMY
ncbi:clarin-1 [Trichechus manatus latirostris]|uniref:Clarin-1 n=1 Tax=Trichechus manatus latirostris TaxID=127582 RepID=A0A2Y9DQV3_TRIMA|nr:clarin-1 [Trichechus manatus latirostris]